MYNQTVKIHNVHRATCHFNFKTMSISSFKHTCVNFIYIPKDNPKQPIRFFF